MGEAAKVKMEKDVAEMLRQYKEVEEDEETPKYFVDSTWFVCFIGFVICLNTLIIGLDVDSSTTKTSNIEDKYIWFMYDLIFTTIFIIEMLCKQYFYKWDYFRSKANLFDFGLVVMAILDLVFAVFKLGGNLRNFTILRMARMLRLVRLFRLFAMFKELWLVVDGLLQSLRTILWVSVLLLLLIYVCAIVTTLNIGRNPIYNLYYKESGGWDHRKYFGTMPKSMLTMFQIVTLEDWSNSVARHVISNQPVMAAFFLLFIFATSFGLLNLVVGIIVKNTLSAARKNIVHVQRKVDDEHAQILESLRAIFLEFDVDQSGTIELEEFEQLMEQPKVISSLKLIGVPADEAHELFSILDADGSGILSIDEFIGGCLKVKGIAKSKDLLSVQVSMESMAKRMEKLQANLSKEERIVEKLDVLSAQMTRNYSSMLQRHLAPGAGKTQTCKLIPGSYLPTYPEFL